MAIFSISAPKMPPRLLVSLPLACNLRKAAQVLIFINFVVACFVVLAPSMAGGGEKRAMMLNLQIALNVGGLSLNLKAGLGLQTPEERIVYVLEKLPRSQIRRSFPLITEKLGRHS